MANDTEIELKLTVAQHDVAKAGAALQRLSGAAPRRKRLDAMYFDTSGHHLRKQGYTLRRRQEDGSAVDTLKREAQEEALVRGEWSAPAKAQGAPFTKGPVADRVRKISGGRSLLPQFRIEVERQVFEIAGKGGVRIEAALDIGKIRPGRGKPVAVHELELELKAGTPRSLYDLALRLSRTLPLTLEPRSKGARGFQARGMSPSPSRLQAPAFAPNQTLAQALRSAARRYFAQYLANVAAMLEGNSDSIHMMRVAVRRLRSAISAAKEFLPAAAAARVSADLRTIQKCLGELRDLDVLAKRLMSAPKLELRRTAKHRKLIDRIAARRALALTRSRKAILSPEHTRAWLRVMAWFESLDAAPRRGSRAGAPLRLAVPDILDRMFKQVRKRGRHFERLSPDEKHRLRIAGKKFRYGIELFASLYRDKDIAQLMRTLKVAQDDLGAMNDAFVARQLLKQTKIPAELALEAGESLGWIERSVVPRAQRSARHVRRLRAAEKFW